MNNNNTKKEIEEMQQRENISIEDISSWARYRKNHPLTDEEVEKRKLIGNFPARTTISLRTDYKKFIDDHMSKNEDYGELFVKLILFRQEHTSAEWFEFLNKIWETKKYKLF